MKTWLKDFAAGASEMVICVVIAIAFLELLIWHHGDNTQALRSMLIVTFAMQLRKGRL